MTSLNLQTQPKSKNNLRFVRPEIVNPEDTVKRINEILAQLKEQLKLDGIYESSKYVSIVMYYLALRAQVEILEYLNDGVLSCPIVWDRSTGLPCHPSMAADVRKFVEKLEIPDLLKAVLLSFSEWTIIQSENFLCCCGKDSRQIKVQLDIMINNALRISDGRLIIKKIIGIKSDNEDHLINHYNFSEKSVVDKNIYKVWICENTICVTDGRVEMEYICSECTEQFDILKFSSLVWQLFNQMPSL